MKMQQRCFVIPHKKDDQQPFKVEELGQEVDIPAEELLAEIIERI